MGTSDFQEMVKFNVYLTREQVKKLRKLQALTGCKDLAETIRLACRVAIKVREGLESK